jgi:hypothetical protein
MLHISHRMIEETFTTLRSCGANERECKLYWLSHWDQPDHLVEVAHPHHTASRYGVAINSAWITHFWNDLSARKMSVAVQVHTHPSEAFHSATDDAFPLLFHAGFLSLVIPDFAMGQVGLDEAYLTEIQQDGHWQKVQTSSRIMIDG